MFQWESFGKVKYDGSIFNQDILISSAGDVYERNISSDPNKITVDELDSSIDEKTRTVIIGTGHYDTVKTTDPARLYLKKKKIDLVMKPTPEAVEYYNERMSGRGRKPGITTILHLE